MSRFGPTPDPRAVSCELSGCEGNGSWAERRTAVVIDEKQSWRSPLPRPLLSCMISALLIEISFNVVLIVFTQLRFCQQMLA